MTPEEERMYIDQVLAGNTQAYAYLVNLHKDHVFNLCLKIVKNREDAEEVAQDVFIKAFQALGSFQHGAKLATWLYRIAYNTSLNKIKRKKLVKHSIDQEEYGVAHRTEDTTFESQFNTLKQAQQKYFIQQALDQLNEEDQVLLTLFYLQENSIEEITEITEISKNNVKVKLHRARKKLYKQLAVLLKDELNELL
ncbi:MAG: RNA polymerase sigma factor [Thermonemataceae bacterium]